MGHFCSCSLFIVLVFSGCPPFLGTISILHGLYMTTEVAPEASPVCRGAMLAHSDSHHLCESGSILEVGVAPTLAVELRNQTAQGTHLV